MSSSSLREGDFDRIDDRGASGGSHTYTRAEVSSPSPGKQNVKKSKEEKKGEVDGGASGHATTREATARNSQRAV